MQSPFSLPCALATFALALFGWLTFVGGAGAAGEPAALVFPLTWSDGRIAEAYATLEAPFLDFGPLSNIIIVLADEEGLTDRARDAGVVLVLNSTFAALCGAEI